MSAAHFHLKDLVPLHVLEAKCAAARQLLYNEMAEMALQAFVDQLGLTECRYLDHGNYALVFDIGDGMVLRVSGGSESRRPDISLVLQPLLSWENEYSRVEILPRIQVGRDVALYREQVEPELNARKALEKDLSAYKNYGWIDVPGTGKVALIYDAYSIALPSDQPYCLEDRRFAIAQAYLRDTIFQALDHMHTPYARAIKDTLHDATTIGEEPPTSYPHDHYARATFEEGTLLNDRDRPV